MPGAPTDPLPSPSAASAAGSSTAAAGAALAGAPLRLKPGETFGAYRIDAELGEGGMGVVYRAVHATLGRPVALKVMRGELGSDRGFAERFLREARVVAAVSHPHVVTIHDAGECGGLLYMAFELVAGGDLAALLDRRGRLPAAEALRLIDDCAAGVEALHAAGVVHRDIKPTNLFLDAAGRAKLGDFGLARSAAGDDRLTQTGLGMGTPAYMSPEQAHGLGDIDVRSDIHALGGTLYTLLTRVPPYDGATAWVVVNKVCNEPAPDPRAIAPEVPAPVAALTLRAMAKAREDRFQTPREFRAALAGALVALGAAGAVAAPPTGASSLATPVPILPPGALASRLGALRRWWWPLLSAYGLALLLLPLPLCPLLGIHRAGAWPYDEPRFWGSALLLLAGQAALLWLPLRLLAQVARPAGSALTPRDQWPALLASGVVAGVLAAYAAGAVCELFRWRGGGWPLAQQLLGASAALAWWVWIARHPLRVAPLAWAAWQHARLGAVALASLAVSGFCHLLVQQHEPPARREFKDLVDHMREVFASPNAPVDAGTLANWPTAAALAVGAALALALLAPGALLWSAARRR